MLRFRALALAGVASAALAPGLPARDAPAATFTAAGRQVDKTTMPYYTNVELTTHEGKKVRFYDDLIRGKIVILNFMYTLCGDICPGMTDNLVEVQQRLGDRVGRDVFIYSFTLQPQFDGPEELAKYAEEHGAGKNGWTFLTGKPEDLEMLRRKLGFVDLVPAIDAEVTEHIGVVRIGNETTDRWAASPALADPDVIVDAVLRLERSPTPLLPVGRSRMAQEHAEDSHKRHSHQHHD
jgi:protein SCO1/2